MQKKRLKILISILFLLLLGFNITYAAGIDDADWIFERLKQDAKDASERSGKTYAETLQTIKENIVATDQLDQLAGSKPTKDLREELNNRIDAEIAKANLELNKPEEPDKPDESNELTLEQKETIENAVRNWIYNNKDASNYKELLQEQMNLSPSGYTESELEYRRKLYQAEYDSQKNKPSEHGLLGTSTPSGGHTVDEVINEGRDFIGKAEGSKISTDNLQAASNTLYNILLTIGIFLAVAVGMYLSIKFMLSSAEDKAKVKESLVPYIAGCVVIFGAFIIWKLAIILLRGIA